MLDFKRRTLCEKPEMKLTKLWVTLGVFHRYEEQLEEKIAEMKDYFAEFALPDMKVFKSSPSHYRMRYV